MGYSIQSVTKWYASCEFYGASVMKRSEERHRNLPQVGTLGRDLKVHLGDELESLCNEIGLLLL